MKTKRWRWRRFWLYLLVPVVVVALIVTAWTWWAEENPQKERELRVQLHEELQQRFPEHMTLPESRRGFVPRTGDRDADRPPDVILIHGLDEPGDIWDDLVPVLDAAGIHAWEFRYPNDQAVDRSTDLLADYWRELPADHDVVLIGHSMGGLVIRDFVSRWRHPADGDPAVDGARVHGTVLVGTPNHGSEWARLRVWLGLREFFASIPDDDFSLFASLQEGTGAAKIDLRPGSEFLTDLNARPWPEEVPVRIIGGVLGGPDPDVIGGISSIAAELDAEDWPRDFESWWFGLGEELGDGVVPVDSLSLAGAPPPAMVSASHRGLLSRTLISDEEPPAIPLIMDLLAEWQVVEEEADG
ncbi:alpha/beta fold hydrolase [Aquisalimonas sp.]|uniref:esterase/lipase family protein n=1 Tax=unclassified Aquisalimonas TaxID=2644645 RepID=UPI0025C4AAFC|nr:alpha/beta fold hydrolase [Aquisalimonas sp.]